MPKHQKRCRPQGQDLEPLLEITLPTGRDQYGEARTAVCCLSSLSLETWDEWKDDTGFIEDVMRFLDNVLQDFIERARAGHGACALFARRASVPSASA
jgi:ribonucleoside-diphosphate reductase alpha chain